MGEHIQSTFNEIRLKGLAASPGIALGKAFVFNKRQPVIDSTSITKSQIKEHLSEFHRARELTENELSALLKEELDDEILNIISAQVEMVRDPELGHQVEQLISVELHPASYAVQKVFENYLRMLSVSGNHVARERVMDIKDTRDRLIEYINDQSAMIRLDSEYILVAKELSPREVIKLSEGELKGIIMDKGGPTCHAAIIARAMGIPAVVGAKNVSELVHDKGLIAMNGSTASVIINPTDETVQKIKRKIADWADYLSHLKSICHQPSVTKDGHSFTLRANIEFARELPNMASYNAKGIGLLRTESIYLTKEHFENQKKQEAFYTTILAQTGDDPVTIRLFDAGGDKFFNIGAKEGNPFLGWRGIRMLLDEPDLLSEQLKAIYLAAEKHPGRVKILMPMVTNVTEVIALKKLMKELQKQLAGEGHEIDPAIELGIMVEVPSVAILAGQFAKHVDFFSIGTNDLTQYTLAVDRGNELISELFNQRHPAVWHMIRRTVDAAKQHNIGISVCGELASDPEAAACLLGMGINELSMSPVKIPEVKQLLIQNEYQRMKDLSIGVLQCATAEEVDKLFENWKN